MAILDFDWRRLMRWSIVGAVVMLLWLFAPTAKCSWKAFRDEPLDEAHPMSDTSGSHKQDVVEGDGFFERWGNAIKYCYKRSPPFSQEEWKRNLFVGFIAASIVFYALSEFDRKRKKTYS